MHWLVRSLIKNAIRVAGNVAVVGILPVGEILADLFDDACRRSNAQAEGLPPDADLPLNLEPAVKPNTATQIELREGFAAIAQEPFAFQTASDEFLDSLDLEPRVRETASAILAQVPSRIQTSMRRPEDPTGRSVPANFTFDKPESLAPFVPDRLPRFRKGDVAVPGSDLIVQELLGVGGFGEVWKATHRTRPYAPPVALKYCTDPTAVRNLRKEVNLIDRVASAGRHPNIVNLLGVHGLDSESPCLEYEYIDGGDLSAWSAKAHAQNEVDPDQIAGLMLVLARAVGHLHRLKQPIVHRDLKPANILMTREDGKVSPKVADFGIGGIAATQGLEEARHATLANSTTSLGSHTPLYASPQQINLGPPDPRDDVYALGVIWYQLLLGDPTKRPQGGSWRRKFAEAGLPEAMILLIERCVDGEASERPADAQVLADELAEILKPPVTPEPVAEKPKFEPLPPLPGFKPMAPLKPLDFGPKAEWHYADGKNTTGPVTIDALRDLASAKTIGRKSQVWKEGTAAWVPASSVPDLFPPEPPPLPPQAEPPPLPPDDVPEVVAADTSRLVLLVPKGGSSAAVIAKFAAFGMLAGNPNRAEVFKAYLNGKYFGEGSFFEDFEIEGEVPSKLLKLEIVHVRNGKQVDRKEFRIDTRPAGRYRIRFNYVKSLLGGMSGSSIEFLKRPGDPPRRRA